MGLLALSSVALAQGPSLAALTGTLDGKVLAGGSGRVFIMNADGQITWQHKAGLVHDTWLLANGNILYADEATVTEVAPDQSVAFCYKAKEQHGGGTFSCQRLANGNTLIGENSSGRVLETDKDGKVVFQLQTAPFKAGAHQNMRMARKLDNGNYLVCQSGANLVKEYTPEGKVVREIKTPALAFAALRTPEDTTLVACLKSVIEYDAKGQVVWQFNNTDIPGVVITNMTGLHLLPSKNLAITCYRSYNKNGEGTAMFEITHDKKLVWRYGNPKAESSVLAIERLDAQGKPLAGACLR